MSKFSAPCRFCKDGLSEIEVPEGYKFVADEPTITLGFIKIPFVCEKCGADNVAHFVDDSSVYRAVTHRG